MKTLYLTQDSNILIDQEENTANHVRVDRNALNKVYLVDEPMHVVYSFGEEKIEQDVEKDDIILIFYEQCYPKKMTVIKNNEWAENLKAYRVREQELKEKWAERQNKDNQG